MADSYDSIPQERTLLEGLLYYISILLEYKAFIIITHSAFCTYHSRFFSFIFNTSLLIKGPLPNQYRAYAIVLFQEGGGNTSMSSMLSAFGVEPWGKWKYNFSVGPRSIG